MRAQRGWHSKASQIYFSEVLWVSTVSYDNLLSAARALGPPCLQPSADLEWSIWQPL